MAAASGVERRCPRRCYLILALFGRATQKTPQQRASGVEAMLSGAGFHVNAADAPEDAAGQEQVNFMIRRPDPSLH